MEILDTRDRPPIAIHDHGSRQATVTPIGRGPSTSAVRIALGAGGVLGMHEATVGQLFLVVEGSGWVRTGESERHEVTVGSLIYWSPGELHETGTEHGLVAIVVEAEGLRPVP